MSMMQAHARENTPELAEGIFAVGVFAVCGLILYFTRDSITVTQIFTLLVLGVVLLLGLRYPSRSIIGLTAWLVLESVGLKFIPSDSFVFVRFFPEVLLYALIGQLIVHGVSVRIQQATAPHVGVRIPQQRMKRAFVVFVTLFILIGLFSVLANSVSILPGLLGIRQIVRFIFLGILILYLPQTTHERETWWKWILGLFIVELVIGGLQFLFQGGIDRFLLPSNAIEYAGGFVYGGVDQFWQLGTRLFGTLGRYDRYGAFIGFMTVVVSAIPLSRLFMDFRQQYPVSQRTQRVYTLLFAAGCLAVFLSSSRAALFGIIIAVLWLLIIVFRKRWIAFLSIGVTAIILLMAFSYAQIMDIQIRYVVDSPDASIFERLVEPLSEQSLRGNYENFGRTFWFIEVPRTVAASSPIIGVGPGMFGSGTAAQFENRQVYNALGLPFGAGDDIGVIDNSWFALWAEFGTLGLVCFVGLFGLVYRYCSTAIQHRKEYETETLLLVAGAQAALVFAVFIAFFGNHFEIRTTMVMVWSVPLMLAQWHAPHHRGLRSTKA